MTTESTPNLTSGETVYYEGGPARGDLILSVLIGLTVIGLPIAIGAIVRALWLRYRITSRRVSVEGGWLGRDRTQVVYSQIREVLSVPRGFGAWGDMVLVLNDGSRLEMRSVPRFRELEAYIEERRREKATAAGLQRPSAGFGETPRAIA
ncbi:MAG: PH domain-containing protein [Cyanobium sp. ELA507]